MPAGVARSPRSGTLNRRIQVQKPVVTAGQQKFQTFLTLWAKFVNQTGLEQAQQLGPTNIQTSLLETRYVGGILPKMRVLYGTRVLEIMSVINVEEGNHRLQLVCKEATV